MFRKVTTTLLASGCLAAASLPAQADLVFIGNIDNVPGGTGNSGTVLSLTSPGNSTTETGSVGVAGCFGDIAGGCGSANNPFPLRTFASVGITSASDIVIYLDAEEPGNDNLITLTDLRLDVFGAAGNDGLLFSASYLGPDLALPITPGGGNNTINAFALDATQAGILGGFFNADYRVGLFASLSDATGGPDRFFLSNREDVAPIPIPAAVWLLGSGLLAMGAIGRRRISARV